MSKKFEHMTNNQSLASLLAMFTDDRDTLMRAMNYASLEDLWESDDDPILMAKVVLLHPVSRSKILEFFQLVLTWLANTKLFANDRKLPLAIVKAVVDNDDEKAVNRALAEVASYESDDYERDVVKRAACYAVLYDILSFWSIGKDALVDVVRSMVTLLQYSHRYVVAQMLREVFDYNVLELGNDERE